jgi:response regulator of citrate/malate metabolism
MMEYKDSIFVLCTAMPLGLIPQTSSLGFNYYLEKPIEFEELKRIFKEY